tara:strand:+ start:383 stop:1180 length:798 start_codon:yes stop_codon:yes gene_type:complete
LQTKIDKVFADFKKQDKTALITFITAGDPDYETCLSILKELPKSGANIIELGMPFTDPMADGPIIQASAQRAIKAGHSMQKTFDLVRDFRISDKDTPIVLMGYYNPIYSFGNKKFLDQVKEVGIDALIIVDLPPEEDTELCDLCVSKGVSFIRLATPTTNDERLKIVLEKTSGFLYYVSITGITGSKKPQIASVERSVKNIKNKSNIPIGVGFGIKSKKDVKQVSKFADAVIVGSAIVSLISEENDKDVIKKRIIEKVSEFASVL